MKMPRDVVISTKTFILSHLAILLTALLFFAGLYYILYQDKFQPSVLTYLPVTQQSATLFLEVGSPDDDTLVYEDNLLISGKTNPGVSVVISTSNTDAGLQSGQDGQFSKIINLTPGANVVEISVFDVEGNSKTVKKSVYYSEEKI